MMLVTVVAKMIVTVPVITANGYGWTMKMIVTQAMMSMVGHQGECKQSLSIPVIVTRMVGHQGEGKQSLSSPVIVTRVNGDVWVNSLCLHL